MPVTAGTTYFIVIDGYNGAVGGFELQIFDAGENIIFSTTSVHTAPEIGSIFNADGICQTIASNNGLPEPENFIAWLSTSSEDAVARLGNASGWIRPDGQPFAVSRQDLTDGRILYPPRLNEVSVPIVGIDELAFTGTNGDGTMSSAANTCSNWTSSSGVGTAGSLSGGTEGWTNMSAISCLDSAHLYCLGAAYYSYVPFEPQTGRHAFISEGLFLPEGNLGVADTLCTTEATAAGLDGNYFALLSSTYQSASSWYTDGEPWVRADGVVVISDPVSFIAGGALDAPINQTASGDYIGIDQVWTGANFANEIGTLATSCNNWNPVGGDTGITGMASRSDEGYFSFPDVSSSCTTALRIYCLETGV